MFGLPIDIFILSMPTIHCCQFPALSKNISDTV